MRFMIIDFAWFQNQNWHQIYDVKYVVIVIIFRPKVSIIGSREQMCINSEVMKMEDNNSKVWRWQFFLDFDILSLSVLAEAFNLEGNDISSKN